MAGKKTQAQLTPEEKLQQALVPEAEQPYKVPANWCWTYVKYVSEVVTGGTPSKKHTEYYSGNFPFFKPADLDAERYVYDASEYLSEEGKKVSRIIPKYSTAVCCIGSIGKSGYLEVEGTTNQQINSAIPKFNSLYLYYFIKSEYFIEQLWRKASATTISIVNKSKMEDCVFPLPPLTEQQRIVERIESLFTKLDEAKEKLQNVLDDFETRKAAILHKAFTGELTVNWRKQHGISIDSWEEKMLSEFVKLLSGQDFSKEDYNSEKKGIPYITGASNIENNHVIINRWTPVPTVIAKRNDILVVCKGSVGIVVIADFEEAHIARQIMAVRTTDKVIYRYLFYSLESKAKYLKSCGKGIIPGISRKQVLELKMTIPTLPEQTEIVRIIDDLLAKEQQVKELAETALTKIDLIKKAILTRAFRGELGTNNPANEPAVELLERVL